MVNVIGCYESTSIRLGISKSALLCIACTPACAKGALETHATDGDIDVQELYGEYICLALDEFGIEGFTQVMNMVRKM